jgi:hypothetical protein
LSVYFKIVGYIFAGANVENLGFVHTIAEYIIEKNKFINAMVIRAGSYFINWHFNFG